MADISHWKGNRSPSLTDVIRVDGAPFPLTTSTVKFKMRAEGSSTLKVDAAATVTDAPNGAVRYDWQAADVDTAGEYLAWWEVTLPSGKTQDTPEFNLAMMEHAALTRSLCELEDVTAYAPGYRGDSRTDSVIEQRILEQSLKAHHRTAREFKAITPAVATRRFDLEWWNLRERKVCIGDASAISTVKIIDPDQVTELQTVASTDYVLWPRVRQEWEPITALVFPVSSPAAARLAAGNVLEVNGTWGFPAIPANLREAIAQLVIVSYINDVTAAGTAFSEALAEINIGALFANAREIVDSFATPQVA